MATNAERVAALRARRRKREIQLTVTLGSDEADEVVRAGYDVRSKDPKAAAAALRLFIADTIACNGVA